MERLIAMLVMPRWRAFLYNTRANAKASRVFAYTTANVTKKVSLSPQETAVILAPAEVEAPFAQRCLVLGSHAVGLFLPASITLALTISIVSTA